MVDWKTSFVASCADIVGMMSGSFHDFHVVFEVFVIIAAYKVEEAAVKNWSDDFQPYFGHLNSHYNN